MDTSSADRELTTTRRIPALRAKVWTAFTDPTVLATWWGPDGFTNTFQVCELRPGGAWRFTMHGPDGKSYPNESRFVELHAPERWVIEHASPPHFRLTAMLTERGGETEVHWRQTFASAADCTKLRSICVPANEQNLRRLAAAVAKLE
ncbi:MAG: SRPBCC domain-containing protein [Planctomycetes bacterium]|nr:SRPBCC domain-containing protein [Planctomycetota bacterium]